MKLNYIITLNTIIENLINNVQGITPSLKFKFLGIMRELSPHINNFETIRNDLIRKYGKTDEQGMIKVEKEDTENFNSQIKKDSMPNGNIISRIGSKADIQSDKIISNDSENVNKKFSMKDSVEDNGELIAVHNIYRVTPKTACIG